MTWNHDMTAAPRGKEINTTVTVDGKERTKRSHQIEPVWLAAPSGKVHRSYWVPETTSMRGHWSGFTVDAEVIAWQPFIVPAHPFHQSDASAFAAVMGKARLASADSAEPLASGHFFLEDCGSGA